MGMMWVQFRCVTRAGRVRSQVSRRSRSGTGVEPPKDGLEWGGWC